MINNFYWLKRSLSSLKKSNKYLGKTIIFTPLRTFSFQIHQEMFMANILAREGAKVEVLFDDGLYDHWDTFQASDSKKELNPSKHKFKTLSSLKGYLNFKFLLFFYRHPNIKVVGLKSILDYKEIQNVEVNVEDNNSAISSVRRYFGCGYYDKNNDAHQKYYLSSLKNCKISTLHDCRALILVCISYEAYLILAKYKSSRILKIGNFPILLRLRSNLTFGIPMSVVPTLCSS